MIFLRPRQQQTKGFTMIEILVYLAIFAVLTTASVTFLFSLDRLIGQYKIETALYRSGSNAMEQILLGIRQADQVDMPNTILETPGAGKLTVENSASTTAITLTGGALELALDGEDFGNLMYDGVVVDEFTVYHYTLATGEFVRVKLRLTATVDSLTKSLTLYGGAVVRGAI